MTDVPSDFILVKSSRHINYYKAQPKQRYEKLKLFNIELFSFCWFSQPCVMYFLITIRITDIVNNATFTRHYSVKQCV